MWNGLRGSEILFNFNFIIIHKMFNKVFVKMIGRLSNWQITFSCKNRISNFWYFHKILSAFPKITNHWGKRLQCSAAAYRCKIRILISKLGIKKTLQINITHIKQRRKGPLPPPAGYNVYFISLGNERKYDFCRKNDIIFSFFFPPTSTNINE